MLIYTLLIVSGLAAPAAAFTSAPYVINAPQEPYVGTLIAGKITTSTNVLHLI